MGKWTERPEATAVTGDDLLLIVNDPAGTPQSMKVTFANLRASLDFRPLLVFEFGDGNSSSSLAAGQTARIPYTPAGTIVRARIEGDTDGSAVVDIRKATADPPVYASIAASAKPTLSTDEFADDTTLTGWTTSLSAGNALMAVLESVSGLNQVTVVLEVERS